MAGGILMRCAFPLAVEFFECYAHVPLPSEDVAQVAIAVRVRPHLLHPITQMSFMRCI